MSIKGMMIAASVAGMFATGAARVASAADKKGEEVTCSGINSCKGTGSCHGAGHACAGKNGQVRRQGRQDRQVIRRVGGVRRSGDKDLRRRRSSICWLVCNRRRRAA